MKNIIPIWLVKFKDHDEYHFSVITSVHGFTPGIAPTIEHIIINFYIELTSDADKPKNLPNVTDRVGAYRMVYNGCLNFYTIEGLKVYCKENGMKYMENEYFIQEGLHNLPHRYGASNFGIFVKVIMNELRDNLKDRNFYVYTGYSFYGLKNPVAFPDDNL